MEHILVLLAWVLLTVIIFSCRQSPEPGEGGPIRLTAYDAGVTDARIRLQVSAAAPYTLSITRDGKEIFSSSKALADTLVLDTGLLPKHAYTYRGYVRGANILESDSSALLTLTTMDTTSHGIQWTLDTLGDGASSMLNDVFILNDTCAFAVGAVYFRDSLGNFDGIPYNFLKWNGKKWELRKASVMYKDHLITVPLEGVYAFSEKDIWLVGSFPIHGNGYSWEMYHLQDMGLGVSVEKAWGKNSSDMYFSGWNGSLVHYDGTHWTQLQTGTTMEIQDIYGAQNKTTGRWEILATAGNYYVSNERKILSITDTTITALSDSGINWALSSVWFVPGKQYWVVGDGIWKKQFASNAPLWIGGPNIFTTYITDRIRGTGINDVFICGAYGELIHFNGSSWRSYQSQISLTNGKYQSVAATDRLVIAVGYNSPLAVIATGKRR
jgi:hypothetical protein